MKKMRSEPFKALAVLLIFLAGFKESSGQQAATIRISGKVTDAENNSPLAGASILVSGSKSGTHTDVEGRFFLDLDKNSPINLQISNTGYHTKEITDAGNTANEMLSLNIQLDRNNGQLQNVFVRTNIRKESLSSLYQIQKNSSSISDGISAEAIRKSPDKNTGEVLKRVSGASVQDNKFVVIRGMNERYNVSMLNNSVLPSTEADKKAFAFNILPSSLIDNLIIYKSVTADLPGDFSGGAVKVLTRDFPVHAISELSLNIGINSLSTGKNFYKSFPNGSLDALGFFDDSRLIPGSYYRNQKGFILKSPEFKKSVTKQFPDSYGYAPAYKSLPSIAVSYTGGNTSILNAGKRFGYIYSIGYGNGRVVSERQRSEYPIDKNLLYDYNTVNYDEKNNLSALLNLSYSFRKSKLSWKNLFNNEFIKNTGVRDGYNTTNSFDPFYIKSVNSEATQNGIFNSVLEGVHKAGQNWTIDWNTSLAFTYRNQPDQRIVTLRSDANRDADYYLRLSNENSPEIRNAGRVYSFLAETIYGASVDATRTFRLFGQQQKLKFGTMNYLRDRNVQVIALGYATLDPYGTIIPESKETTFRTIFDAAHVDQYNLTVANIETNSTDYKGRALLNAGYLMLDNKLTDRFKLTWGARIESYDQELNASGKTKISKQNTDILPSVLLTYSLNNKTNLRLSGSQSVNRPEFRELADYSVYDYDNYFVIRGNPGLLRSRNNNADIRYEFFPAAGEVLSASLFYKYFNNPIEQTNLGNDVLSYQNADHANIYGAEIEIRKKLDFINNSFFNKLSVYANGAYMKGSVKFAGLDINSPLQGQSPYLVNSGISYASADEGFSVNVLYNRIGPRLRFRAVGGGALNVFERPRDVVDMQVSRKFFKKRLEIKLTVSDLLAQPVALYYKFETNPSKTDYNAATDKIISSARYGSTGTISLRYSLNAK